MPWPGSVMQMQGTTSPEAIPGSQADCCSAVALRTTMSLIRAVLMIRYAALKSARPTSSAAIPAITAVASCPPYSSGMRSPVRPIPAMSTASSRRNTAARSSDW